MPELYFVAVLFSVTYKQNYLQWQQFASPDFRNLSIRRWYPRTSLSVGTSRQECSTVRMNKNQRLIITETPRDGYRRASCWMTTWEGNVTRSQYRPTSSAAPASVSATCTFCRWAKTSIKTSAEHFYLKTAHWLSCQLRISYFIPIQKHTNHFLRKLSAYNTGKCKNAFHIPSDSVKSAVICKSSSFRQKIHSHRINIMLESCLRTISARVGRYSVQMWLKQISSK